MKFQFTRRNAKIGVLNTRNEKHGKEAKVPAADITIKFPLKLAELDTVVITATDDMPKFSEVMFDEKGNLLTNMISPLKVNRKPEGLYIVIFDKELPTGTKTRGAKAKKGQKANGVDPATALEFDACKAKDITLELGSGPNLMLSFKVALHPNDKDWARLINIMEQEREVLIEARQEELFGDDADDDEEEENEDDDE
jgi:hypothetical protein